MPVSLFQIQRLMRVSAMSFAALLIFILMSGCSNSWRQWFGDDLRVEDPSAGVWTPEKQKEFQAHGEIFIEMITDLFLKPPQDQKVIEDYSMTLLQGASYEGIYNGFVHSAHYRKLENLKNFQISTEGLKVFCTLLEDFRKTRGETMSFAALDPLPIPEIDRSEQAFSGAPVSAPVRVLVPCLDHFKSASFFTLKRFLGDEALRAIEKKSKSSEDLALWYGQWAEKMNRFKVDFGLGPRNEQDAKFHERWVSRVHVDLLRWEVLNRVHRVLNHYLEK